MKLMKVLLIFVTVGVAAGCTTSGPASVPGLTRVVGNSIPGTRGYSEGDQDNIDDHVARGCRARTYNKRDCDHHSRVSAQHRKKLKQLETPGKEGIPPVS